MSYGLENLDGTIKFVRSSGFNDSERQKLNDSSIEYLEIVLVGLEKVRNIYNQAIESTVDLDVDGYLIAFVNDLDNGKRVEINDVSNFRKHYSKLLDLIDRDEDFVNNLLKSKKVY